VLALSFGHAILKACKCQCIVEDESFLILRPRLVTCCGTSCSSLYRVSTVRWQEQWKSAGRMCSTVVCDFKIGISQSRFVNFSRRVCMGLCRVTCSVFGRSESVYTYRYAPSPFFHWIRCVVFRALNGFDKMHTLFLLFGFPSLSTPSLAPSTRTASIHRCHNKGRRIFAAPAS
jgi:hypothetical protein